MRTYKVHWIYILVLTLGLSSIAYTTTRELIDPDYYVPGGRYLPTPIRWCLTAFCWYKLLTTVYRVEIDEQGCMTLISFVKKKVLSGGVQKVKESTMFIDVVTSQGSICISTLIDGISNVRRSLNSLASTK